MQWFQGYEVDSRTVAVVLNTLAAVFPEVEVWRTLKHDLLLVASTEAREIDLELLRRRVSSEPYATAMRSTWHTRTAEGVLARFIAGSDLAASLRGSPTIAVNTDDRNLLEFMLAKSVGRHGLFDVETLREGAQGLGADRPRIASDGPQPDWVLVERERIGAFYERPRGSSSDLAPLLSFHGQWRRGDGAAALETWTSAGLYPVTDAEHLGLAAAAGFMGDRAAEEILQPIEGSYATEASILRGRMLLEQGDTDGAFSNFAAAVERLREIPWAHAGVFGMLFESLDRVVTENPSLAPAVFDLLGPSFAVERARDERLWLRFRVASMIGAQEFATVLEEVEPWVPWDPWMLQKRAMVRGQMRDPRAQEALSDVGDFARNAPVPFTSIGGRRVPASEAPPRQQADETLERRAHPGFDEVEPVFAW